MSQLANFVLFVHFIYVLGVIVPVFLIPVGWKLDWRWVKSRVVRAIHVGMMGFVLVEVFIGMACPLTVLENALLADSGKPGYEGDFIAHWVSKIMYWEMPPWVFMAGYAVFFTVIVLEWKVFPPRAKPAV
jgi:hypothetical protein